MRMRHKSSTLQELGFLDIIDLFATDPKRAAKQFLKDFTQPQHVFDTIQAVHDSDGSPIPCFTHGKDCVVPGQPCDLLVAGFPCAPYSGARPTRHSAGSAFGLFLSLSLSQEALCVCPSFCQTPAKTRWEMSSGSPRSCFRASGVKYISTFWHLAPSHSRWAGHPETAVLFALLRWVKKARPSALVLENVVGLRCCDSNSQKSAYDMIRESLGEMGYEMDAADIDAGICLPLTRRRTHTHTYGKAKLEKTLLCCSWP